MPAEEVVVLPNSPNVVMAAAHAAELSEKVVRFDDSLAASKARLTELLEDIHLETPKEIS